MCVPGARCRQLPSALMRSTAILPCHAASRISLHVRLTTNPMAAPRPASPAWPSTAQQLSRGTPLRGQWLDLVHRCCRGHIGLLCSTPSSSSFQRLTLNNNGAVPGQLLMPHPLLLLSPTKQLQVGQDGLQYPGEGYQPHRRAGSQPAAPPTLQCRKLLRAVQIFVHALHTGPGVVQLRPRARCAPLPYIGLPRSHQVILPRVGPLRRLERFLLRGLRHLGGRQRRFGGSTHCF